MVNFSETQKNNLIRGGILIFLILMLLFPYAAFQGASSGLLLWFHNILPNLLPFIIISNLMIRLNITRQISRVFYPFLGRIFHVSIDGCYPIAIGFLSGIPMGAKAAADLVTEHKICRKEGQFLLGMCNNASPMFILGYIAITQLMLPHIKYALFAIIYGSAILGAAAGRLLSRRVTERVPVSNAKAAPSQKSSETMPARFSFGLLDASIMNGFEVVTKIGGYIILFSILCQMVHVLGPDIGFFKAFLMGLFEITTGIGQICKSGLDTGIKIVLITVLTSFGGFSGIAQTKSVLENSGLSVRSYVAVKLISSGIAFALAYLYVILFLV